ncbi:MAG: 1,4-alpha-glucan branching protein GlgB [Bacteroidota bacterium]
MTKTKTKKASASTELKKPQAVKPDTPVWEYSLWTEFDIHLFREGKHFRLYEKLGSHILEVEGTQGVYFSVWAPNATRVSVIGNFNGWDRASHPLHHRWDSSGIWEGFIPAIGQGEVYKYHLTSREGGQELEKADLFAFAWEEPPRTASIVWDLSYTWKDKRWMNGRSKKNSLEAPVSVYEVHLASWKRKVDEGFRSLSYRELADDLVPYVKEMGYTHVEFMPVMEHPFGGSWGYQIVGYFAPTSRQGTPQDFMYLVEAFHKAGIGVFLDWVPSHFPGDAHGIYRYDGTALYEHEDPRKGFHPDWKSYIFNYGRNEVRSFLISNALFWLDLYHADGLRVDAVASMLYLDYSREAGEWVPNAHGGRENLEAISLMRELNEVVYAEFPDVQTIAEESTSWPMVSRPTFLGGLGFGMKWMMGWMNDTLEYFKKDPVYRKHHQNDLTFSMTYAFTENFMLPLSHDEVVHGKGPLIGRMPGDEWQRFANLRLLYGFMYTHPGAKLLFMGGEFGQTREWDNDDSLHWDLLQFVPHQGMQQWVKVLNAFYRKEKALFQQQYRENGFQWIDHSDHANSVIVYLRQGKTNRSNLLVACNLTPVPQENYRIGVPFGGKWKEVLNSDAPEYFGSGFATDADITSRAEPSHGHAQSLTIKLPPLAVVVWKKI